MGDGPKAAEAITFVEPQLMALEEAAKAYAELPQDKKDIVDAWIAARNLTSRHVATFQDQATNPPLYPLPTDPGVQAFDAAVRAHQALDRAAKILRERNLAHLMPIADTLAANRRADTGSATQTQS